MPTLLDTAQSWKKLHILRGQSNEMAQTAATGLPEKDTKFSDLSKAKQFVDHVRQIFVGKLAMAKKQESWTESGPAVIKAIETVVEHYPLAKNKFDAQWRTIYWQEGMRPDEAMFACMRDIFDLTRMILHILPMRDSSGWSSMPSGPLSASEVEQARENVSIWAVGIFELLSKLSSDALEKESTGGERFALIFLTEDGNYREQAIPAFHAFVKRFGLGSELYMPDQLITVATRTLGRAVDERDIDTAKFCLLKALEALKSAPEYVLFLGKELAKNSSRSRKDKFLTKRYHGWSASAVDDEQFLQALQHMTELVAEVSREV